MIVLRRSFVKGLDDQSSIEINETIKKNLPFFSLDVLYSAVSISSEVRLFNGQLILETILFRHFVLFYYIGSFCLVLGFANDTSLYIRGKKSAFIMGPFGPVEIWINVSGFAFFAAVIWFLVRDSHKSVGEFLETLGATVE